MKIGLRSVDGTYNMNFGSSLQCIALHRVLQDLFPNDEILYVDWVEDKTKELNPTIREKDLFGRKMKSTQDPRILDKCVIGSDCIMHFNKKDGDRSKDIFLMDFPYVDKVLYAIGSCYPQDDISDKWEQFLGSMDYVSIRDIDNRKYIPNSMVHMDPTLLLDKWWWSYRMKKPDGFDENTIKETPISYCPWFSDNDTSWFKKPEGCLECFHNEKITSPFEFLWMLYNCKEIHSYSFHALIFSILFNKRYYVHNGRRGFKIINLMKLLGIKMEDGLCVNRDEVMERI